MQGFGTTERFWDFRSPGRGRIDFEGIIRMLNHVDYHGPLTVEWEDSAMDREHGAKESVALRAPARLQPQRARLRRGVRGLSAR